MNSDGRETPRRPISEQGDDPGRPLLRGSYDELVGGTGMNGGGDALVPRARPIALADEGETTLRGYEMLLLGNSRTTAWIDLARLTAFLVLFELAAGVLLAALADALFGAPSGDGGAPDQAYIQLQRVLLLPILLLRAGASIFIIALIVRQRGQTAASVGLHREELGSHLLIGAVSTAFVYGLTVVSMTILWYVWPNMQELMKENVERLQAIIPRLNPGGLACLALTVGVYEELLFRGFMMTRLRRALGNWPLAVLISTAVFTALHWPDQTAPALVPVAILSLVFSVVTIWRRSLVPAIIGHTLFDLIQLLYMYVSSGGEWS